MSKNLSKEAIEVIHKHSCILAHEPYRSDWQAVAKHNSQAMAEALTNPEIYKKAGLIKNTPCK